MQYRYFAVATVLLFFYSAPVAADTVSCAGRSEITSWLSSELFEQSTGNGLRHKGGLIEIWTAPDGSTWTILLTLPNGTSCLLDSGTNWHQKVRAPRYLTVYPSAPNPTSIDEVAPTLSNRMARRNKSAADVRLNRGVMTADPPRRIRVPVGETIG